MLPDVVGVFSISPVFDAATCNIADDCTASRSLGKKKLLSRVMCKFTSNARVKAGKSVHVDAIVPFQGMLRFCGCDSSYISLIDTRIPPRPFSISNSCRGVNCRC